MAFAWGSVMHVHSIGKQSAMLRHHSDWYCPIVFAIICLFSLLPSNLTAENRPVRDYWDKGENKSIGSTLYLDTPVGSQVLLLNPNAHGRALSPVWGTYVGFDQAQQAVLLNPEGRTGLPNQAVPINTYEKILTPGDVFSGEANLAQQGEARPTKFQGEFLRLENPQNSDKTYMVVRVFGNPNQIVNIPLNHELSGLRIDAIFHRSDRERDARVTAADLLRYLAGEGRDDMERMLYLAHQDLKSSEIEMRYLLRMHTCAEINVPLYSAADQIGVLMSGIRVKPRKPGVHE